MQEAEIGGSHLSPVLAKKLVRETLSQKNQAGHIAMHLKSHLLRRQKDVGLRYNPGKSMKSYMKNKLKQKKLEM
jgi:uncharacterized membrane protein